MNTSSIFYFIKSSFKSMYKNALMTLASIFVLIACMLIIGSVFLGSANVVSFMNTLEAKNEIVAFINEDYGDDTVSRNKLCDRVKEINGVSEVEYVTKEQALAEYRASLGDDGDYLEEYTGEDNPLRNELRIKISDIELFSSVVQELTLKGDYPYVDSDVEDKQELESKDQDDEKTEENNKRDKDEDKDKENEEDSLTNNNTVEFNLEYLGDVIVETRDSQSLVDFLLSVRNVLQMLGFWILIILALVSLFIISNTVKLTMYSRRNEINIMKYVGATNGFIRFPFVLEGIIIGIISTVLSLAMQWCIYSYVLIPLLKSLPFLSGSTVAFKTVFPQLTLIFAAIGLIVGIFGSALSIRKYLKV